MIDKKTPFKHIALWSPTPQQGKSTIANYLENSYDYKRLSFAAPLLDMIETFLMHHGLHMEEIDYYCKQAKEQPIPGVGQSYRHLARTLGTEWGRNLISQTTWLDALEQKFDRFSSVHPIVIDDLRFRNEAVLAAKKGCLLVQVTRNVDRRHVNDTHQSDIDLASFDGWDCTIGNNGTLKELYKAVSGII